MVNYRGGEQRRPFWSMLSISPIFYRDELMLYVASLQDYSCHMDKLVSLKPSQFCRTLEHHQRGRHVKMPLTALQLAKPTVYQASAEYPLATPTGEARVQANAECLQLAMPTGAAHMHGTVPPQLIKRLGWSRLALEPEHLRDRVADVLQTMGIDYELSARADCEGEVCSISAAVDGISMRVMIAENPDDGCFTCAPPPALPPAPACLATPARPRLTAQPPRVRSVSVTRVSGDTFQFHEVYRDLRGRLALEAYCTGQPSPRHECAA